MSCIATACRRRRQAANGYKHLKRGGKGPSRPIYHKISASKAAARLRRAITKVQDIARRKGMKNKG